MNRRRFIGYTGLGAITLAAGGGFLDFRSLMAADRGIEHSSRAKSGMAMRMNGGRCHDHQFFMGQPTAMLEKEIFGV